MKKKSIYTFCLSLICSFSVVFAQDCEKSINVFFDFDKDYVKSEYEKEVLSEIKKIGLDQITEVSISGHTDSKGSVEYNVDLSKRRNSNVKKVLPETLFTILKESTHGELQPFEKENYVDDKRYSNNRRVEVLVKYKCGKGDPVEASLSQVEKDQQQLDEFVKSLEPESLKYTFDNNEEQFIKTEKGTIIFIEANSFVKSDGSFPKEVHLEVLEYYDMTSIVGGELTTRTIGGEQLETAGMVFIEAKDKYGKKLEISDQIVVGIPYTNEVGQKEGMELYEGRKTDNGVEWNRSMTQTTQEGDEEVDGLVMDPKEYATYRDSTKLSLAELQEYKNWQDEAGRKVLLVGPDTKVIIKTPKIDTEAIGVTAEYRGYFFNVTKMGFVNCDRSALKGLGGKDINVKMKRFKEYKGVELTYLVFTDINSVATPDPKFIMDPIATFSRIPEGLDVVVLSLVVKDGEMFFAKQSTTTSEDLLEAIFELVSEEEFKNEIEGLIKL